MKKSNLDEMQENKLLKIERNGYRIAFWGLIAVIIIEQVIGMIKNEPMDIVGECVILIIMCIYVLVASIKNGIWDRNSKPDIKRNVLISFFASLLMGVFGGSLCFIRLDDIKLSIIAAAIMSAFSFFVLVLAFAISAYTYNKKKKELEELADRDENEK